MLLRASLSALAISFTIAGLASTSASASFNRPVHWVGWSFGRTVHGGPGRVFLAHSPPKIDWGDGRFQPR